MILLFCVYILHFGNYLGELFYCRCKCCQLNVKGLMAGLEQLYEWIQCFITFDTLNKCCRELHLSDNEDEVGMQIEWTPKL